jgi:hypothetical protein
MIESFQTAQLYENVGAKKHEAAKTVEPEAI